MVELLTTLTGFWHERVVFSFPFAAQLFRFEKISIFVCDKRVCDGIIETEQWWIFNDYFQYSLSIFCGLNSFERIEIYSILLVPSLQVFMFLAVLPQASNERDDGTRTSASAAAKLWKMEDLWIERGETKTCTKNQHGAFVQVDCIRFSQPHT